MAALEPLTSTFVTDPVIGVSLSTVDNPISSTSISGTGGLYVPQLGPQFQPGQKWKTNAGTVLYACAGVTITAGDFVYFNYDSTYGEFTAKEVVTGTPSTQLAAGVALVSSTAGQFSWFFVGEGYVNVSVVSGVSANTALTTTATSGALGTGGTAVNGAISVGNTTSGAAVIEVYFSRGINLN